MTGPAVPTAGRRAVILFETLLSLALFVGAAVFALQATRSVLGALDRGRRDALAVASRSQTNCRTPTMRI